MELIGILITSFDRISWLPFVSVLSRLLCVPFETYQAEDD